MNTPILTFPLAGGRNLVVKLIWQQNGYLLPPARGKAATAGMQEVEQRRERLPRMGVCSQHD